MARAKDASLRLKSLDIIKRKVVALQSGAAGKVGAVFNPAEIEALERLARGERVAGVDFRREWAVEELAWIARGGEYDDDYGDISQEEPT